MLFGNENGEHDQLLFKCPVKISSVREDKYIYTGRWGSGKSGHLFLANMQLTKYLQAIDKEKKKLWYIDENSLDVNALNEMRRTCGDTRDFRFRVERIWKAEIVRAASVLLGFMADTRYFKDEAHWKFVLSAYKGGTCVESLWHNIGPITALLFSNEGRTRAAAEIKGSIEDMATAQAFTYIQRCIADVRKVPSLPEVAVAIEPIDTPKSPLETADSSMAQDVIAALINTFIKAFIPEEENTLRVYLSIPWHRYVIDGIVNPHKRRQYESTLLWQKDELRDFIRARIALEFQQARRSFNPQHDTWNMLFIEKFRNTYCNDKIEEDSFDYIVRHTHHRPRDVQRICRRAVEICATTTGRTIADIVSGKGGIRVDAPHIRKAVLEYSNDQYEDFQEEVRRRFPRMTVYENAIRGIPVPFSVDELDKRGKRLGVDVDISLMVKDLWEAGYLGIEARCNSGCDPDQIKAMFSECTHVMHKAADNRELHRWYMFSYNTKGDPLDIIASAAMHEGLRLSCVLHPRTFEQFSRSVTQEWPIGV